MKFSETTTQYVAGIDVHKDPVVIRVMDRGGTVVCRRTLREKKREGMRRMLRRYQKDITVGVESTYNWYWIADTCRAERVACAVGHAVYVKRKMLGKNKSDMVDAQGIAEMVRHDELPLAYCYPAGMRATRDLLRVRRSLVKMRAMRLQHHQCTEDQYLLDEEPLEDAGYDRETIEDIRRSVRSDERCVEFLTGEIEELERHIRARAQIQDREMYELLTAVAGIGDILALTVLYEVHTIERFPRPQAFASYCRVVNPQHESGGKRSGSGNRRAGNRWLSWAMQEIVTYTCRYNPAVNAYYKGLEKKKGRRHARRILAHKWAVTIYHMMKKKEAFSWEKFVGTAPRGETMQTTGHASSAAHHAAPAV